MKKEIIKLLEAADDPKNCECPRGFNRNASLHRVINLQNDLEKIVGQPFELNDRICDASYFAELDIKESKAIKVLDLGEVTFRIVRLRFSCFGNFFTVLEESLLHKLDASVIKDIIAVSKSHDFVYIDEDILLEESYTGCNKELEYIDSWWERYFDLM